FLESFRVGFFVNGALVGDQHLEGRIKSQCLDFPDDPGAASARYDPKRIASPPELDDSFAATLNQLCRLIAVVVKPEVISIGPQVSGNAEGFVHGVPIGRVVGFIEFEAEVNAEVTKCLLKSSEPGCR